MRKFFDSPIGKTIFDIVIGCVVGAGIAALALPEDASAKAAAGAIFGGAILGGHRAARELLRGALEAFRKPSS